MGGLTVGGGQPTLFQPRGKWRLLNFAAGKKLGVMQMQCSLGTVRECVWEGPCRKGERKGKDCVACEGFRKGREWKLCWVRFRKGMEEAVLCYVGCERDRKVKGGECAVLHCVLGKVSGCRKRCRML